MSFLMAMYLITLQGLALGFMVSSEIQGQRRTKQVLQSQHLWRKFPKLRS